MIVESSTSVVLVDLVIFLFMIFIYILKSILNLYLIYPLTRSIWPKNCNVFVLSKMFAKKAKRSVVIEWGSEWHYHNHIEAELLKKKSRGNNTKISLNLLIFIWYKFLDSNPSKYKHRCNESIVDLNWISIRVPV